MNRHQRRAAAKSGQEANSTKSDIARDRHFNAAISHYQAGQLGEAEKFCQQILQSNPQDAETLHLLGVLYISAGQYDVAVGWISQAVRLNNQNPHFFTNLANALRKLGKHNEALEFYRLAIELKPDLVDAYFGAGRILQISGLRDEAIERFNKVLALQPDHLDAHSSLVVVLHESGRTEDALAACDHGLARLPKASDLYNNRGVILQSLGRFDEALLAYDRAIETSSSGDFLPFNNRVAILRKTRRFNEALQTCDLGLSLYPDSADLLNCKGVVLMDLDRFDDALDCCNEAIKRQPDFAAAFSNRAKVALKQDRTADAIADCGRAIALQPSLPEAFLVRGRAYKESKQFAEAAKDFERAIELRRDFFDAIVEYGTVLHRMNRFEEALTQHERAIALNPEFADGFQDRASVLQNLGRYDEALQGFEKAIALNPNLASAHWNEALVRLLIGDFQIGWEKSEWRWKLESLSKSYRQFAEPMWNGEPLAGKTILLHNEQGLGDAIQFARYIPKLAARGAKVVLDVPQALNPVLSGVQGVHQTLMPGEQVPDLDFHCSLLSLPRGFGTTLDTIPSDPYLCAPIRSGRWEKLLQRKANSRIGIVWSGNPSHDNDHNRSIPLDIFIEALDGVDATFVCLQKDIRPRDSQVLESRPDILDPRADLNSFADTAELIAELDLIISVDTSVAHLAGALQLPVWVLLPYTPDWRWLLNRNDSPWYPTMRLFRQIESRDWKSVLKQVNEALRTSLAHSAQNPFGAISQPSTSSSFNGLSGH